MKATIVTCALLFMPITSLLAQVRNKDPRQQAQSADALWQTFSPADKSFSIDVPSPPEHEYDAALSNEPFVGESYSSLGATDSGLAFYTVGFFCLKEGQAKNLTVDSYLKGLMSGARSSKVNAATKPVLVNGVSGSEFVQSKPGSFLRTRSVVIGPRLYMLSFITATAIDSRTLGMRFFNSFHINRSLAGPLPGCPSIEGRLPIATRGKIHIVQFPGDWMDNEPGHEGRLLNARWYEVRSAPTPNKNELFFGALSYRDGYAEKQNESWYGKNFYAVSLESPVQVRAISGAEWKRAMRVSQQAEDIDSGYPDVKKSATVKYKDKEYAKSAENWGSTQVSPNGHWIAVYSYSGQTTPSNFMMSGLPRQGDIYWDVYDTRTGAKVLAWTAKIVRGPGTIYEGAVWVDDKYLVMPFGGRLDSCVIGVLPAN